MGLDSTKYREYLHQVRSHPPVSDPTWGVSSKSLLWTLGLFLALELGLELQWEDYPAGLLFPLGYLVLWALLITFYYPAKRRSFHLIMKNLFQDVLQHFWEALSLFASPPSLKKQKFVPPQIPKKEFQTQNQLPRDLENALGLLGLKGCRDWKKIQKRYRELAKKFHPDLNPDLTQTGNRFIIYDGAYRKLSSVKDKYFS